jgi:2-polyprenyl-3-methyl-5-hydroxy-6-metoxy-1,4-benzoquinol methylase
VRVAGSLERAHVGSSVLARTLEREFKVPRPFLAPMPNVVGLNSGRGGTYDRHEDPGALPSHEMSVTERYDDWHRQRQAVEGEHGPEAKTAWHLMALKHLGDVAGLRVLEIGCGSGEFSKVLGERGATVTAADISPVAVDHARKVTSGLPVTVEVADVMSLPYGDETFDLVVSLETLEHTPDPFTATAQLVRVTKRRGRLIITTPNYMSLMGISRGLLRLVGQRFTEGGQPINKFITLPRRLRDLRRLGCRVDAIEGRVQQMVIPGFSTFSLPWLDRPMFQRFSRHVCTVATRL